MLRGSINYLLTLEGQAVWVKMIALSEVSGGRPGFIEDNNQRGLPHEYIAQELHCPIDVFEEVLKRMSDDGAIKSNGTGSIELVNFKHYQFSEYDRQKPYREAKKNLNNEIADDEATEDLIEQGEKSKTENPEWIKWRRFIFAGLKERRGYPITKGQISGEAKTMTELFKNGYCPEQIIKAYDYMKKEPFWATKTLTLMSVSKQIGEVLKNGENIRYTKKSDPFSTEELKASVGRHLNA